MAIRAGIATLEDQHEVGALFETRASLAGQTWMMR